MLYYSSKPHAPMKTLCLLLSAPEILPYIVRSYLLDDGGPDNDIWENTEEIQTMLDLPISEFAERADAGTVPEDFYCEDAIEWLPHDELYVCESDAVDFSPIPRLIPPGVEFPGGKNQPNRFSYLDGTVYFFKKKPSNLGDTSYKDGTELIEEAKAFLAELRVDLPDDFPYWKVIGTVQPYD